ncbi:hypothetical protein D9615_002062 [Tricholomella constricta]|uniref:N-acetyltransferase domain-containing protein n=1 Tax=Tricholomella constricta TaxID=117010 RepID=A0A8H5MAM9_9AGAR|nr:hypothetical protein D9615_002062 [Tricholomella constricta]
MVDTRTTTRQTSERATQWRARNLTIRQYRHPGDLAHVRRIFIDASTTGPSSPYLEGMAELAPPTRLIYAAAASVLSLEGIATFQRLRGALWLPSWMTSTMLHAVQGLIGCTVLIRWLYLIHRRRQFHRVFSIYMDECMAGELGDIVGSFDLHVTESGDCVPTGPSDFWVAEVAGEVVGFVGLNNNIREDPTVGDVRRLNVAPGHQGKGIAKDLMDTLTAHARAHNLHALELTTSDYNKTAMRFYQRIGFKHTGRRIYYEMTLPTMRHELGPAEILSSAGTLGTSH